MLVGASWIVLGVMVFLIVMLYTEWMRPAIAFMVSLLVFLACGILSPKEALSGFGNEQLGIIVLLLILGNIFEKTKVLNRLFRGVFKAKTERGFLFRMTTVVGTSSAFLNNTPLVAMFLPSVYRWAKDHGRSPSQVLIPVSDASILGGCVTLIGTSTNLVVNGLLVDLDQPPLDFFAFTFVGAIMLVLGIVFLLLFSKRLLPGNKDSITELLGSDREYFLETHIKKGSPLIGKSVEDAGLRNLQGMYLVEIIRQERMIRPVSPKEVLAEGDELYLAGNPESIADLTEPDLGLSLPKPAQIPLKGQNDVVEVVVASNSRLIGKKVKESDFRGRYDGAILAIHRNGEKLRGQIGEVTLRAGDLLLVLTGKDFFNRTKSNPQIYVISKAKELHRVDPLKTAVLAGGLIVAIGLAVWGVVSLFLALAVLVLLCLLLRITSPDEIRNKIDFNLVFIIACGLAFGTAMQNSGAASLLSDWFLELSSKIGVVGLLAGLFVLTNLLSAFMTTKAAVALIIPVTVSLVLNMQMTLLDLPMTPFVLVVAFGAAANFLTPFGYQTNLMVYGPGGYKFKDFLRIGAPLTLLYGIVCVLLLAWQYNLL